MHKSHLALYILFVFTASIILLNRYTDLYISDYRVHFFFLFYSASSFVIIVGHFFNKLKSGKSMAITFLVVGILCFLKAFFTWGGDWKTQTIVFQNRTNSSITIDSQLRADQFSFGYKKRIIQNHKIAPFVSWTTDIDTLKFDRSKWEKVDLKINEMRIND